MNTPSLLNRRTAALWALLVVAAAVTPQLASRGALQAAEVNLSIDIAPPPPRREVVVESERPSHDAVWIKGYWIWRDGRHFWVAGHWERPPHPHAVWVEPRWEHHGHGYVFIKGYWR